MYVMVIEDYCEEEYLGNVRDKKSIVNYKTRYWGYTEPMNETEIANMIAVSDYANWYAVIDLERMEILTLEEEEKLLNYSTKDIADTEVEWFFKQFKYNKENS